MPGSSDGRAEGAGHPDSDFQRFLSERRPSLSISVPAVRRLSVQETWYPLSRIRQPRKPLILWKFRMKVTILVKATPDTEAGTMLDVWCGVAR
jgi:hypothetical protein